MALVDYLESWGDFAEGRMFTLSHLAFHLLQCISGSISIYLSVYMYLVNCLEQCPHIVYVVCVCVCMYI